MFVVGKPPHTRLNPKYGLDNSYQEPCQFSITSDNPSSLFVPDKHVVRHALVAPRRRRFAHRHSSCSPQSQGSHGGHNLLVSHHLSVPDTDTSQPPAPTSHQAHPRPPWPTILRRPRNYNEPPRICASLSLPKRARLVTPVRCHVRVGGQLGGRGTVRR